VTAAYGSYPVFLLRRGSWVQFRYPHLWLLCLVQYIKNIFLLKQTKKVHHRNVIGVRFSFSLMWQLANAAGVEQLSIRKAWDSARSDPQYFRRDRAG